MKKSLLVVLLTVLSFSVRAQKDPCKDLTKTVQELKGITKYSTPLSGTQEIILTKIISKETNFISLLACIEMSYFSASAKGLYIKFEDGTILKDEEVRAEAHYRDSNKYMYYASLILTDEQVEKFSKLKVVKYGIYNGEIDLSDKKAVKLIAWINCLNNLNQ